jgi:hypothetical protein
MLKSTLSRRAITKPIVGTIAKIEDAELLRLGAEVVSAYEAFDALFDAVDAQVTSEWQKREDEANYKLNRAIVALCQVQARNFRDLVTKARIAEIDSEVVGRDVAQSVIRDLLALAAVDGDAVS